VTRSPDSIHIRAHGWRTVRLGDITSEESAFCDGPFGSNLKTEHYTASGARVVRLQNIGAGKFLDNDRAYISVEHFQSLRTHSVEPGDVVVAALGNGARPAGRACQIPSDFGPGIVKADCFRLRMPDDVVFAPYLIAILNSPMFLSQIADRLRGATRPRMTLAILKDTLIPLPPLSEQERVAAILNEKMVVIEQARVAAAEQSASATHLEAAYFRQAFQSIVPLSASVADDPAPLGWRWEKLETLAQLQSGHTPSRHRPDWWGGDIPWLALPDIRNLDGQIVEETSEHTNQLGLDNSSARLLPKETVCLSRTASVGFVTILGRPMATSQDFVNWICGPKLDPVFLMHLLRASRKYIRSLSSGAIHKTVYVPTVKAFRVCIPDISEQRRIASFLTEKFREASALRDRVARTSIELSRLPATLLSRAFSGEL
jgi:type I restriction enzyme, S subunit